MRGDNYGSGRPTGYDDHRDRRYAFKAEIMFPAEWFAFLRMGCVLFAAVLPGSHHFLCLSVVHPVVPRDRDDYVYVRNQEEAKKLDMQDGRIDGTHNGKTIAIARCVTGECSMETRAKGGLTTSRFYSWLRRYVIQNGFDTVSAF